MGWRFFSHPRSGNLVSFALGVGITFFGLRPNTSISIGSFALSCGDPNITIRLLKSFDQGVTRLKTASHKAAEEFVHTKSVERKREILKKAISFYLVPTSCMTLFGSDVIVYNGKGQTIMMSRADYDEILANRMLVLNHAGVKAYADAHKIGDPPSTAFDSGIVEDAQHECLKAFNDGC
jgi:hypothetical protein